MKIMYFCPDCGGSAETLSHRRKPKYNIEEAIRHWNRRF